MTLTGTGMNYTEIMHFKIITILLHINEFFFSNCHIPQVRHFCARTLGTEFHVMKIKNPLFTVNSLLLI